MTDKTPLPIFLDGYKSIESLQDWAGRGPKRKWTIGNLESGNLVQVSITWPCDETTDNYRMGVTKTRKHHEESVHSALCEFDGLESALASEESPNA